MGCAQTVVDGRAAGESHRPINQPTNQPVCLSVLPYNTDCLQGDKHVMLRRFWGAVLLAARPAKVGGGLLPSCNPCLTRGDTKATCRLCLCVVSESKHGCYSAAAAAAHTGLVVCLTPVCAASVACTVSISVSVPVSVRLVSQMGDRTQHGMKHSFSHWDHNSRLSSRWVGVMRVRVGAGRCAGSRSLLAAARLLVLALSTSACCSWCFSQPLKHQLLCHQHRRFPHSLFPLTADCCLQVYVERLLVKDVLLCTGTLALDQVCGVVWCGAQHSTAYRLQCMAHFCPPQHTSTSAASHHA